MLVRLSVLAFGFLTIPVFSADENPDHCKDILINGVMKQFDYTDRSVFRHDLTTVVRQSTSEEKAQNTKNGGSGKIGYGKISASGGGGKQHQEIATIATRLQQDSQATISDDEMLTLCSVEADQKLVNAWLECMKLHSAQRENLSLKIAGGDPTGTFIAQILWTPSSGFETTTKIIKVDTVGLDVLGKNDLVPGASLNAWSGVTQSFKRSSPERAAIIVTLEKLPPAVLELDAVDTAPDAKQLAQQLGLKLIVEKNKIKIPEDPKTGWKVTTRSLGGYVALATKNEQDALSFSPGSQDYEQVMKRLSQARQGLASTFDAMQPSVAKVIEVCRSSRTAMLKVGQCKGFPPDAKSRYEELLADLFLTEASWNAVQEIAKPKSPSTVRELAARVNQLLLEKSPQLLTDVAEFLATLSNGN